MICTSSEERTMPDNIIEEIEYPGDCTLEEINNDLVVIESVRTEKLVELRIIPDGPDGHLSLASMADRPIGAIDRLVLVPVPDGDLESVIEEQAPNEFLFSATIWVEDEETEVAAFR